MSKSKDDFSFIWDYRSSSSQGEIIFCQSRFCFSTGHQINQSIDQSKRVERDCSSRNCLGWLVDWVDMTDIKWSDKSVFCIYSLRFMDWRVFLYISSSYNEKSSSYNDQEGDRLCLVINNCLHLPRWHFLHGRDVSPRQFALHGENVCKVDRRPKTGPQGQWSLELWTGQSTPFDHFFS